MNKVFKGCTLHPVTLDFPSWLQEFANAFSDNGLQVVLVGGAVRDAILGKPAKDMDFEIYGGSFEDVADVAAQWGKLDFVGKQFGVLKLSSKRFGEVDLSLPRTEEKVGVGHTGFDIKPNPGLTFKKASSRRDLTINSLGYDPISKSVVDAHGGLTDLRNKVLRNTTEKFREDPLRVVRVCRFAASLPGNFLVDPTLATLCKDLVSELSSLPVSRLWMETEKALKGDTSVFLTLLVELDVLEGLSLSHLNDVVLQCADEIERRSNLTVAGKVALLEEFGLGGLLSEFGVTNSIRKEAAELSAAVRIALASGNIQTAAIKSKRQLGRALTASDIEASLLSDSEVDFLLAVAKHTVNDTWLTPKVAGADLIQHGLKPGPSFKTLLTTALDLQDSNVLLSKDDILSMIISK